MPTKTDLPVKNKEDVSFEVERIIGSRKYKGKQQYLIKWVGLGSGENSWVDYDLMNCEELVKEFEERKKKKQQKLKESNGDNKEIIKDNKPLEKQSLIKGDKKMLKPQKGSLNKEDKKISFSPAKEDRKISSSPAKEDKKISFSPAKEDRKISSSPAKDRKKISVSPAKEDKKISPSPAKEDKQISRSPTKEDGKISRSPAKEDKKISLSPTKEENKSVPKKKIEPSTPNKKHKSTIKEKDEAQTPKLKTDRINKLSPKKQKDFTKSVEDSEAMNKNKLLNVTLSNIQKRFNLPPNRNIPNTYDCIVDKVEGIITKNQRRLVKVLFIDGTRNEINLEIAKIGLPIHLINYYESKN